MTTARDRLEARAAAGVNGGIDELADELAQRLADLLADRLAVWFGGIAPARAEPLVDAAEVARIPRHDPLVGLRARRRARRREAG